MQQIFDLLRTLFTDTVNYLISVLVQIFFVDLGLSWLIEKLPDAFHQFLSGQLFVDAFNAIPIVGEGLAIFNWAIPIGPLLTIYLGGLGMKYLIRMIRWLIALIPTLAL